MFKGKTARVELMKQLEGATAHCVAHTVNKDGAAVIAVVADGGDALVMETLQVSRCAIGVESRGQRIFVS